jgi:hypothetical protein
MKCERCGKEAKEEGINPPLLLKALGLYPTDRMTLFEVTTRITLSSGITDAELGRINIGLPNQRLLPNSLHRLPGRPINAYTLINGVAIRVSLDAAPTTLSFLLKYQDVGENKHIVMGYSSILDNNAAMSTILPIITANQLGERPNTFGTWVLEGTYTLGASTSAVIDISANFGILYGAP